MNDADLPDPDDAEFYARYCETCRAAGVEPNTRDRVRQLLSEWNAAIARAGNGDDTSLH